MSVARIFWYSSGIFAVCFILTLFISYAPGAEPFWQEAIPLGGAVVSACVAVFIARLPSSHWVHRSRAVWAASIGMAVAVTLLVAMVIG